MKINEAAIKPVRMELLPLMDCMFLLLVFFIYSMLSMVTHQGISVDLPKATSALVNTSDYTSISITETGDLFFNKTAVSFLELSSILTQFSSENPTIYVNADKNVRYESVSSVLDLCRRLSLTNLSLEMGQSQ